VTTAPNSLRHGLVLAAAGLLLGVSGWAGQYAPGQLIPELRLRDGTVLHAVTVTAVGSSTVLAKWEGGRGSLPLAQLPDDLRADLMQPAGKPVPAPAQADPAAPVPPPESLELPAEIKLTNGFVMRQSRVVRWQADAVVVQYQGGTVPVRFTNIAPDQRAIFEARKEEELGRQARDDARKARGAAAATHDDRARQITETQAHERAERKAEEIRSGISNHSLVKGMSKAQVILAFGRPPDDKGDIFYYASRGHDKYGHSADRTLVFRNGILVGWRDQRDQEPGGAVEY
jgi:hypothetical protein